MPGASEMGAITGPTEIANFVMGARKLPEADVTSIDIVKIPAG